MVYTYTPAYYSSFQDTITSLCKSILPFGIRRRRPLPDQKLAKRQSDNLKWQQDSFHRILHLIGLHKEGMVPEADVAAFRIHLLDTLIAAPAEPEPAGIDRDKLLFLQELFYSKCISAREYHSSKRPLLQRLAAQGVELQFRDVIVEDPAMSLEEEWSVIDLRDKEPASAQQVEEKAKHPAPTKAFISNAASWKGKGKKVSSSSSSKGPLGSVDINAMVDTSANASSQKSSSVLMPESSPLAPIKPDKSKRKQFRALFQKGQKDDHNENMEPLSAEVQEKKNNIQKPKKQWGFDGLKKWNRSTSKDDDESKIPYFTTTTATITGERLEEASAINSTLVAYPIGEGSDAKKMMNNKVSGDNMKKKEISGIKVELNSKNQDNIFADELMKMETMSNKLPIEKSDLNNKLPKSWCQAYGDTVPSGMETLRKARDLQSTVADTWVAFEEEKEEEKNCDDRNLFAKEQSLLSKEKKIRHYSTGEDDPFLNNPFYDRST